MPRSLRKLCAHGVGALLVSASCAGVRATGGGALEPRFIAVHNTLSSMGLAPVGPIHEGSIGQGKEERSPLTLPAGCFTIVVMASAGVQGLEASLLDAHGAPIAHEAGGQSQAVLRPCLDAADTYALAIRTAGGT